MTRVRSGFIDDANQWFAHPRDLITTFWRIVYLAVETDRIDELLDPSANSQRDERRQR